MSRQASWRNAVSLRVRHPFRLVLHDEPAISGPPAVVGEAEEGEGLWSPLAAPLTRDGREPAKLDQPRLALMKHQAKAGQPHLEGQEHFLAHLPCSRSP
jgi:hypothetical protein